MRRWSAGDGRLVAAAMLLCLVTLPALSADYVNFESSHVNPIALTPSGGKLLVVNTPDAALEVYAVDAGGELDYEKTIPVGLEPVTVVARTDSEAWVVNNVSDTVSVVDLAAGVVTTTLRVGDEPTDVVFAGGKAFVAVSDEDAVKVYNLASLSTPPTVVPLFGRDVRALDVSGDGSSVYAVVLKSGNLTSSINSNIVATNQPPFAQAAMAALELRYPSCDGVSAGMPPAPRPPLPAGVTRNPALPVPPGGNPPTLPLIVKWNTSTLKWEDETGTDWSHCLHYRPADNDLFVIDSGSLAVTNVKHLGTILFDVSVHPNGKIYVPHTEARNFIPSSLHPTEGSGRFEHLSGVRGRPVDNRFAVVDPASSYAVTQVDLNTHINRSVTPGPLAERQASVSQPGMLVWTADGSDGFLTAIGSRKLFRVDGTCLSGSCIFGGTRATPEAVEVGEGPTGVALLEDAVAPGTDRLYVLNRISHSIALVNATSTTLTKVGELPLHDPSSTVTKEGRRFLYDGVDTSGHGDSACSSCHISGDMDLLAWELGNPEDGFVPYSTTFDNVRFIKFNGASCDPDSDPTCSAATGFDPQKGPMTTQSLRGMLEPLHWRGDRPTMRDFNGAFHALMGTAGPLSGPDMDKFRDFALEIRYPPNPFRETDDTLPNATVQRRGMHFPGNPVTGSNLFQTGNVTASGACVKCHTGPFGASAGVLGGLEPSEPTSTQAPAMFSGVEDQAVPNDLQIPHIRNAFEKYGATWAKLGVTCGGINPGFCDNEPGQACLSSVDCKAMTCGLVTPGVCDNDSALSCTTDLECSKPESKTTFGVIHDGSVPSLYHFFTSPIFTPTTAELKDLVAFVFHFASDVKPAVGQQVTVPGGSAPTGTTAEEDLITLLLGVGDRSDVNRHCDLVATTTAGGAVRSYYLDGNWVPDASGDATLTTSSLRSSAQSEITFTCGTIDSGVRLGADRDEDGVLNFDDCGPSDGGSVAPPVAVDDLVVTRPVTSTQLDWTDQSGTTGPSLRYRILDGSLSVLQSSGLNAATTCATDDLDVSTYVDPSPDPAAGDGDYYLVVAANACDEQIQGTGRDALLDLSCP